MRAARWAIFVSGRGSNAQALWEMTSELDLALCVSSRKKSYGLLRARRLGIPSLVLDSKVNWMELTRNLEVRKINRIFLLGFMKILPHDFCEHWQGKIWNLHPSLLPDFAGAEALEKSYEAGLKMGVSIHQVTAEMDAGPLRLQKQITAEAKVDFQNIKEAQMRISQTEQRLVREWAVRSSQAAPRSEKWI